MIVGSTETEAIWATVFLLMFIISAAVVLAWLKRYGPDDD